MERKVCIICKNTKYNSEYYKDKTKKNGVDSRCKDCLKEYKSAWYLKNKEMSLTLAKEWRLKNSDKNTFLNSRRKKEYTKLLHDNYIKKELKSMGFSNEQINKNPQLIEVKRLIIKTKRLWKTSQN